MQLPCLFNNIHVHKHAALCKVKKKKSAAVGQRTAVPGLTVANVGPMVFCLLGYNYMHHKAY